MSKNGKLKKQKLWGRSAAPAAGSPKRAAHMSHIKQFFERRYGIKNRVTKGKFNKAGRFIHKPNWSSWLEYEPNPEAAVHEFAHLWLANVGQPLAKVQADMDAQFGFVISQYGFMKQKRSLFEILPMAVEQVLRRRLGLPASRKSVKVGNKVRTCVETGEPCGPVVDGVQYIRSARNLDAGAKRRIQEIDLGILVFDGLKWVKGRSIDARINARALAKGAKL